MAELSESDVFFVGSIPVASDTAEEVLRLCGRTVGDRVFALPDGELGARRMWIGGLGAMTFSEHPELDPDPDTDAPFDAYKVKPGLDSISLDGRLPYGDAAIASYRTFCELRDANEIPKNVRFQVSLPTPHAAVGGYFGDVEHDWPIVQEAYQKAAAKDIGRMLEVIPASDLVIQWDYCTETCEIVGADTGGRQMDKLWPWIPPTSAEERFAHHTSSAYLAPLMQGIAPEVLYGYHICLGTWPAQPLTPTPDLDYVVRIANALVANTPRRVDFVHLPITKDAGRDYCEPLAKLDIGEARVFLGVEAKDGRDELLRRAEAAREFLPSFGISHYCGYGRDSVDEMPELIADLRAGAEQLEKGSYWLRTRTPTGSVVARNRARYPWTNLGAMATDLCSGALAASLTGQDGWPAAVRLGEYGLAIVHWWVCVVGRGRPSWSQVDVTVGRCAGSVASDRTWRWRRQARSGDGLDGGPEPGEHAREETGWKDVEHAREVGSNAESASERTPFMGPPAVRAGGWLVVPG